jgi:GDP-L-fucose synthase
MGRPLAAQRVMVTGGGGFLGSHVVEALRARGALDLVVPRSRDVDLTDAAQAHALLGDARPDLVIHLAARTGGIGANRRQPGTFFRDNMAMGLNVLEACRRAGVAKVVLAGTVCAYPVSAPLPLREDSLWEGFPEPTNAPYGVAKRALLVMAQAYQAEFGLPTVTLLPANLYGPRDHFDLESGHVIPALIRRFLGGADTVTLWGDGTPTRDFLHVADAAEAFVLAAERLEDTAPVNLGSGVETSIADLAGKIAAATGFTGQVRWDTTQPNGQPRRVLDTSRARQLLGWQARTSLDEGLRETVAWFRGQAA